MDKRFLRAFLTPSRTRLCGYLAYPWCLKHRLWLEALEHPILTGKPCSPADLLFFAKVCAEAGDPSRVTLRDKWQRIRLQRRATYIAEAAAAYEHLRLDVWPQFWEKKEKDGGGSRNRGMPWVLSIVTNLTKAGYMLEDALNLPECQAIWLSTGASIQAGGELDILTSEDEALLDSLSRVDPPAPAPDEPRNAV